MSIQPGSIINRINILPDGPSRIRIELNGESNSGLREVKVVSKIDAPTVIEVNGSRVVVATSVYRDGVLVGTDWAGREPWG